jgi:acetate kinase
VRRYGFHGLSHSHVAGRVLALTDGSAGRGDLALVSLHLGNGASACAIRGRRSVATSMGLTPTEGLVMGSRSGDLDPGVVGYLCREAGMSIEQVDRALTHDSGLLGLTGASDFREVLERAQGGDGGAGLALEVTVRRIVGYVGAYSALLGRLDALAFTGGIGEHAAWLRAEVLGRLGLFGVVVDEAANAAGPPERRISASSSRVACFVVPAGEEQEIARQCLRLLA